MIRFAFQRCFAALLFLIGAPQVEASLIINGSFEQGPSDTDPRWNAGNFLTLGYNLGGETDITGWTVDPNGQIDLFRSSQAADGNRYIDLTGSPVVGKIGQTFATTIGQEYLVTFEISGADPGPPYSAVQMRVQLTTGQYADFSTETPVGQPLMWVQEEWEFTAVDTETTLQFASLHPSAGGYGPLLDNVVVDAAPAVVPEPATFTLFAFSIASLVGWCWRRDTVRRPNN